MPMAPDPSFGLGWRSGDRAEAQQAHASQQREQSYLQDVLARTRAKEQAELDKTQAEFIGPAEDDPETLKYATRRDEMGRPVYPTHGIYQHAQGRAATERTRRETLAGDQTLASGIRARYPNGIGTGPGQMPPQIDEHVRLLESPHSGPAKDASRIQLNKLSEYRSTEDRELEAAERKGKLAKAEAERTKAETDKWTTKHPDISAKVLPYVSQYFHEYGDGVTLRTLDMDNPAHRQLKIDAMVWAREQMQANDPERAKLTETIRHNKANEARQERELRHKERTEGAGGGGKPITAEATKLTMTVAELGDTVAEIDGLLANPKSWQIVEGYIGPYASRKIDAQTYAPGGALGAVPAEVVQLQQAIATLKNSVINLRTGAAMSEHEANRIMKEIPDINLPPDQFKTRYARARAMIERRRQIVKNALLPGGDRRALLVDSPAESQPSAHTPPSTKSQPPAKPSGGWGAVERIN